MASPGRKPGSDRGRTATDWEDAFAYWAALPPERRQYAVVADRFGVSVRTVQKHARVERWRERQRRIQVQAASELDKRLGHAQAEQTAEIIQIGKATLIRYAEQLRRGDTRIRASEFERISKFLLHLLAQSEEPLPVTVDHTGSPRSREHKLEVLRALAESGAFAPPDAQSWNEQPQRNGEGDEEVAR